jgi:heme/copper-type cytochrome/quinol oxidase subunit 3
MAEHADQYNSASHEQASIRMGGFVVVAAQLVFTGAALAVYTAGRGLGSSAWPAAAKALDWSVGAAVTLVLLAASFAAAMAGWAARTSEGGSKKGLMTMACAGAGALAVLAAALCGYEVSGLGDKSGRFFDVFIFFKQVIMLQALVGAALMFRLVAKAGNYDSERSGAVEAGALFVHGVAILGCFALPLLYLVQ